MLEIRISILQTKHLCAKTCKIKKKVDKSLRKTDGTDQYANFVLRNNLCDHSEASLGQVLQNRRRN